VMPVPSEMKKTVRFGRKKPQIVVGVSTLQYWVDFKALVGPDPPDQ
jgi:hypothetical protein